MLSQLVAPGWRLRRLELDDGEWCCSLSRHLAVPRDFDDAADGRHQLPQLAIIEAVLEAKRRPAPIPARRPDAPHDSQLVWCDNVR